jgi:hypothetical protein
MPSAGGSGGTKQRSSGGRSSKLDAPLAAPSAVACASFNSFSRARLDAVNCLKKGGGGGKMAAAVPSSAIAMGSYRFILLCREWEAGDERAETAQRGCLKLELGGRAGVDN